MNTILIFFLFSNATLVATPAPSVFSDAPACQAALEQITDAWRGPAASSVHQVIGMCVAQASAPAQPALTPATAFPAFPSF